MNQARNARMQHAPPPPPTRSMVGDSFYDESGALRPIESVNKAWATIECLARNLPPNGSFEGVLQGVFRILVVTRLRAHNEFELARYFTDGNVTDVQVRTILTKMVAKLDPESSLSVEIRSIQAAFSVQGVSERLSLSLVAITAAKTATKARLRESPSRHKAKPRQRDLSCRPSVASRRS